VNVVVAVRCHYCSKYRNPKEVMPLGTGGALMCWHCYEWHGHALLMLGGQPPPGCQDCGISFEELRLAYKGGDVKMYLHQKDGIYQILCRRCSDQYVPKRVDLYGATEFGASLNLV
jgi:hypothetical protein